MENSKAAKVSAKGARRADERKRCEALCSLRLHQWPKMSERCERATAETSNRGLRILPGATPRALVLQPPSGHVHDFGGVADDARPLHGEQCLSRFALIFVIRPEHHWYGESRRLGWILPAAARVEATTHGSNGG